MKILRLTRHQVESKQLEELRRIYGSNVSVLEHSETVPNAARVRDLISEYGAEVLEAVLPLPLLAEILNQRNGITIPVIRAVMNRTVEPNGEATFRFSHYERVLKVEVVTERL